MVELRGRLRRSLVQGKRDINRTLAARSERKAEEKKIFRDEFRKGQLKGLRKRARSEGFRKGRGGSTGVRGRLGGITVDRKLAEGMLGDPGFDTFEHVRSRKSVPIKRKKKRSKGRTFTIRY